MTASPVLDRTNPGPDALAHSRSLVDLISRNIDQSGDWISFAEYMSLALYAPGLGYYAAGARKFGTAGDFVTAPELTPLFGRAVAAQAAQILTATEGDILELGAGSGRLAADMLIELQRLGQLPGRYFILEVSPDLRQRQQALLRAEIPALFDRLVWLEALPERFTGFIVGNEVLDALPVHLLHWLGDEIHERGVVRAPDGGLAWQEQPVSDSALLEQARNLPVSATDYLSELCPAAPALVRSLADCLVRGLILFIDYGFPRAEYYHPDRSQGTLMCHHRHRAFDDPFFLPGLTDITAHVDFTALADAALEEGLDVSGYAGQDRFLVNCGLLNNLEQYRPGSVDYLKQAAAVQKILQPTEMGELFKAIGLARAVDEVPLGFAQGDQRHRL